MTNTDETPPANSLAALWQDIAAVVEEAVTEAKSRMASLLDQSQDEPIKENPAAAPQSRAQFRQEFNERLDAVYAGAMAAGDFRSALRCLEIRLEHQI